MQRMRRTQIYLDLDLSAALDDPARQRRTSRAELIRLAARRFVEQEQVREDDAILSLIGIGQDEPDSVPEEHDRFQAEHNLRNRRE